jgi:hypothetical protein
LAAKPLKGENFKSGLDPCMKFDESLRAVQDSGDGCPRVGINLMGEF